ncbi:polysaccharide deacetylase family protein [Ruegeria sp. Ofav3-42]|uniref:polysaccharide deacetylase family protein n=1 Tax=Ruegeria sp. Ofav3-42 TaxID=2917759 RepID=UPI001EF5C500|nr:polysaccharide deacetylase family protein [Ruegeria sp. Ofav3-42]MCG7522794.1 polysaccharide deacetylase family protein [Ruegeria sp. Ofav3-42]
MKKLHVVVTIDIEVPTCDSHPSASGPPDHEKGGAWAQAYGEIAKSFAMPVTYFIHPEVAVRQADLYKKLESQGHCLGLHIHAWRFDRRYQCEFGGLTEDQARQMLSEATGMWMTAFGQRPRHFRPGTMSANDSIFRVLSSLGFAGAAVSLPGRVFPQKHAVWAGAPLDPHRGHSHFRMLEGDLDVVNMPMSVDTSIVVEKNGLRFLRDLRPDFMDVNHRELVTRCIDQTMARDPDVACINLVTHNDFDFSDAKSEITRNFVKTLTAICDVCSERDINWVGSTMDDICSEVLSSPTKPYQFNPNGGRVMFDKDARPKA